MHGSYGNHSDVPRRATVLNYFADGVKSVTEGDLIGGARVKPVSLKQPIALANERSFIALMSQLAG